MIKRRKKKESNDEEIKNVVKNRNSIIRGLGEIG